MRKFLSILTLSILTIVGVAFAIPNPDFTWTEPTTYVDGTTIPATDVLTYIVYCGNTSGGPYPFSYIIGDDVNGGTDDIATCVQGIPGTYFFVATATSNTYNAESAFSAEDSRLYTAADLGRVPLPPTVFDVQ